MLSSYWWVLAIVLALVALIAHRWTFRVFGALMVPEDSIAVVKKKFVLFGKNRTLPDGKIIALNGEAGIQADTLAPGLHWCIWLWQYEVNLIRFITIEEGTIGIVEARDGVPLPAGRVLAKKVNCDSFQSARAFLTNGGERGPQITVIPPGTYRINTALFTVDLMPVLDIPDNQVGIVTTKEGTPLPTGEIAGREVQGHNSFQDAQAFINAGGFKGLQEQVILAGRYFINPLFAKVEMKEMTSVPIANVGVVIAFVGAEGHDVTGEAFKHGNLVSRGQKGVWVDPLDPGKYAINPYTHKVECVPTANVVLNWATGKTEAHQLDKNLSTITVRSSDGFKFNLDVSQIIHIPRNEAPKVIARFGNMSNLVTQVLEPTIGNYFRNAAQRSDAIDFLKNRSERQNEAKAAIAAGLTDYNVNAVDTLIGDIVPPEELMKTLTDRKLAEQRKVTFDTQKTAEETRKELEQAKAIADTQANVVSSQRTVEIAKFNAEAAVNNANGVAQSRIINAEAEARATIVTGNAEGTRITAVGEAEAKVIQLKTNAVGQGNFALIEVGKALAASGLKLVPDIIAGGGAEGGNSGIVQVLMAGLLRDMATKRQNEANTAIEEPKA
ncbi:MAG: Band 7 protein [Candidatus Nomurabacteria bacterium GW2011_GWA2_43_15]|uniref:Band 7 protein n=2 Tax=Candidatus Nomuraibacteriota TaxID=1752729 RepID=A0A0G1DUE1_9BACT|nr:MAG: Band 7 protein [Candidatus Nomurabacteria bacterium GW2011_GWA2_43_15]KKT19272.1 MAG: Band 7 protein [Candidatus Nomurabacteria bacterium GW2011_GWB1_43_7]